MLQTLDDNAMNLQSMTASRFVGPFLDNVHKWEKSLSHISEVVEVGFPIESPMKRDYTLVPNKRVNFLFFQPRTLLGPTNEWAFSVKIF